MAHTLYDVTLDDYAGLVRHLAIAETAVRSAYAVLQEGSVCAERDAKTVLASAIQVLGNNGPRPPLYYRDKRGRIRRLQESRGE